MSVFLNTTIALTVQFVKIRSVATLACVQRTSREHFVKLVTFSNVYLFTTRKTLTCTLDLRGCDGEPCINGATCLSRDPPEFYSCICPNNLHGENCDSTSFNGFQYLVLDDLKTWNEARIECMNRGYNLTSITTREELDFLAQFVG